ncbi:MAG TPA: MarR family transcriptional regulator [Capillimicrobium sp.]|nr:MarR family transcriptional regulator [Capillimicrobium sp.]
MTVTSIDELRAALREMLAAQRRMRGREAQRTGGLSFSQHAVLRVLADGGVHSAGELAKETDLTPASMTKMLDGLSAAGLLERVRDEADRRRVAVVITDAGRAVHAEKEAEIRAAYERVLEDVDDDEIAAMASALRRVAAFYDAL